MAGLQHALPASWYLDEAAFRRERERLLYREWFCAGRADQVGRPGSLGVGDVAGGGGGGGRGGGGGTRGVRGGGPGRGRGSCGPPTPSPGPGPPGSCPARRPVPAIRRPGRP